MKNLKISIIIFEVNNNGEYDGGKRFETPIFIDKKDLSRPVIYYLFLKIVNKLCDKLKVKKEHYDKIEKWKI